MTTEEKKEFKQFISKRSKSQIHFNANTEIKVEVVDDEKDKTTTTDEDAAEEVIDDKEKPDAEEKAEDEEDKDKDKAEDEEDTDKDKDKDKPFPFFGKSSKKDDKPKQRFITLTIKLDSWSPIQNCWGFKYKEKIATDCFDQDEDIAKQVLYSYVDHNISIEKMIGSTIDKSMVVTKDGNVITARVKVDEADSLSKKVADLISRKVVTSNSFIFQSFETIDKWFSDSTKNNEVDLETTYTKGTLISIDPVYKGFYPQCESTIESSSNRTINIVKYKEAPMPEQENKIEIKDIMDARNTNKDKFVNSMRAGLTSPNISFDDVKDKWNKREILTTEENSVLYNAAKSSSYEIQKSIQYTTELDVDSIITRAIDGTSKTNGLALIEILQNSRILSYWVESFPELSAYAQIIPLVGLNKVEQSILIPDKTKIISIAEGADSVESSGMTTNTQFEALRYSVMIKQSKAINNYATVLAKQTENVKDNIRLALRGALYDNMFVNIGSNLDLNNYTGGATKESVTLTKDAGLLTLTDMDTVVKGLVAKWGDAALSKYVISMHPDTLTHLESEYFTNTNNNWAQIYDPVKRTFRGIQIIMVTIYPDKTITAGANVMIFWLKEALVAYGCTFITEDNGFGNMSQDQLQRFVRTRGQIKLCDPNLNTVVLQIRADPKTGREVRRDNKVNK